MNLVGVALQGDSAEKALKARIATEYTSRPREQTGTIVTDLVAEVRDQPGKVREVIGQGIEAEVRGVRQEAGNTLARRETDEAEDSAALREFAGYSGTLNDLDEDLAEFIKEAAVSVAAAGKGREVT